MKSGCKDGRNSTAPVVVRAPIVIDSVSCKGSPGVDRLGIRIVSFEAGGWGRRGKSMSKIDGSQDYGRETAIESESESDIQKRRSLKSRTLEGQAVR